MIQKLRFLVNHGEDEGGGGGGGEKMLMIIFKSEDLMEI